MKILYVSDWMLDAVKASQRPLDTLCNIPALLDTLSADDVAFYLTANQHLSSFIPEAVVRSFTKPDFNFDPRQAKDNPAVKKVVDALERRAFQKGKFVPEEANDPTKVLTCELMNDDTILVYFIPKQAIEGEEDQDRQGVFIERLMRQVYTQVRFETMTQLPFFGQYLSDRSELFSRSIV